MVNVLIIYNFVSSRMPNVTEALQAGSGADAMTLQGLTALHLAVRGRCGAAVQALLAAGAGVSLADCNGSTALHFAVQLGDSGLFNAISSQPGAELAAADKQGKLRVDAAN